MRHPQLALTAALALFTVERVAGAASFEQPAITGAFAVRDWVRLARTERADIVCLGDSNQAYGGHGWDHGVTRAAASRFGLFATGLFSAGENMGWGQGLGYACSVLSTACCAPQFLYAGAPAPLDACMAPDVFMYPMNYIYLPPATTGGGSINLGIQVQANNPIDVNARLAYEVTYGAFPGESGSFRPTIRLGQPPYSNIVTGAVVSTLGSEWGWNTAAVEIPAATRHAALNPRFTPWGTDMAGPVALFTQRLVNLDRARGASVSTLYARGSQSARDMALGLQTASNAQLTLFFSRIRAAQGSNKGVLIRISTGLNDLVEDMPSLGPAQVQDSQSSAAYADNLLAIFNRLASLWTFNGWPESELFFLFAVSHPVSDPDTERMQEYRLAAEALARTLPRCAVPRLDRITTAAEMLANNWYQSGGNDRYHLNQPAYETLSEREIDALIDGACLSDLDADGSIDTRDLVKLLGVFGKSVPPGTGADLNADGAVDTIDLTAFLGRFGSTCQ